jgi:hypothetical protein
MVTPALIDPVSNTDELGAIMAMPVRGEYSPAGEGLMIFETDSEKLEGDSDELLVNSWET